MSRLYCNLLFFLFLCGSKRNLTIVSKESVLQNKQRPVCRKDTPAFYAQDELNVYFTSHVSLVSSSSSKLWYFFLEATSSICA